MTTYRVSNVDTIRTSRPHWYFISIEECVICGTTRITRERRYGKKPPVGNGTTHEYIQFSCQEHFL